MKDIKQPKWKKVEYSRSQIINAGKQVKHVSDENGNAIAIIDNWREAHAYPMHVLYIHLRKLAKNDSDIIVAERLKRLDSITKKLQRETSMNLWTMQDLGGCRFIVENVSDVYFYAEKYESSRKRHVKKKVYDYIKNPKNSGYRSLHVVYEYKSDRTNTYNNNMLIEIQFRTHLQHLWATAVETMGLFTHEAIKSGQGNDNVNRFFILISSLFALIESQPLVPNTPCTVKELSEEIARVDKEYKYLSFLKGIRVAVHEEKKVKRKDKTGYNLLILNYGKSGNYTLTIRYYKSSDIELANDTYNKIEQTRNGAKIDAVLVRVSSIQSLQSAYPNYFSDIEEFIKIVEDYISPYQE